MRAARAPLSAFTIPKTRRRMRRQAQPDSVRLFYFSQIRALMAKAHAMVTAELVPLVHDLRADAQGDEDKAREAVQRIAKDFQRNLTPNKLKPLAVQVATRTSDFQKAQLQAQIKDVLRVDPFIHDTGLAAAADAFTTENVGLIRTVPARYFASIEKVVVEGVSNGDRATTIAQDLEERYNVSESDAARIANDQVGKFFGALNQTRQEELGITGYIWRTVQDNRVRHEHEDLDGTSQDWDDPPTGGGTDAAEPGHPGSGINCRCSGEPDLGELL